MKRIAYSSVRHGPVDVTDCDPPSMEAEVAARFKDEDAARSAWLDEQVRRFNVEKRAQASERARRRRREVMARLGQNAPTTVASTSG